MMAMLKPSPIVTPEEARKPWWCGHCHAFVETVDAGEPYPQCERCKRRGLKWRPTEEPGGPVAAARALPQLPEPPEARKKQNRHKLPMEKRNLFVLAETGYWFCYGGCQEITEESEEGCCVLCDAVLHEDRDRVAPVWQPGDDTQGHQPC